MWWWLQSQTFEDVLVRVLGADPSAVLLVAVVHVVLVRVEHGYN